MAEGRSINIEEAYIPAFDQPITDVTCDNELQIDGKQRSKVQYVWSILQLPCSKDPFYTRRLAVPVYRKGQVEKGDGDIDLNDYFFASTHFPMSLERSNFRGKDFNQKIAITNKKCGEIINAVKAVITKTQLSDGDKIPFYFVHQFNSTNSLGTLIGKVSISMNYHIKKIKADSFISGDLVLF